MKPISALRALAVALVATLLVAAAPLSRLVFETEGGPKTIMVELAATPEQRQVGLMYRRSMPAGQGMLFDFGRVEDVAMWMQNTYVSLDMVFVSEDGRIARIEHRTEPLSTRIVSSGRPVRYVVELLAGTAERIGLKPGDKVIHPRIGA